MSEPTLAELIIPCSGRVAVEVDVPSERTPTGLHLPEDIVRGIHEARPIQGQIIAVPLNARDQEEDEDLMYPDEGFAVGEWVVFGKYAGVKISRVIEKKDDLGKIVDRQKQSVIILNTSDILCKLRTPSQVAGLKVRA